MGAIYRVDQCKITCEEKFSSFKEELVILLHNLSVKKYHSGIVNKCIEELVKACSTSKYIFYVEILDTFASENSEETDAWKAEHPDIIGENVKTCIESAVNDFADAYIYILNFEEENTYDIIYACATRMTNGTNYSLRTNDYGVGLSIVDGVVKFEYL